jgi:hypothetical protein
MSEASLTATAIVMGQEPEELKELLARYDPNRTFAHQPGDPIWDGAVAFSLVLFLDEAPPDLLDRIGPYLRPGCAPVMYRDGRPFISYFDLNSFLNVGFEPGTLWTDLREAAIR